MNPDPSVRPKLKMLLGLAWPVIISRSTQAVMGLADALMVAHLGEASLAAVTAGAVNSSAAFIFPMGICFVVQSFSSQLTGRGDKAGARRFGWYGLGVACLAQAAALAIIPFVPGLIGLLPYSPEVASQLRAYLAIRFLSTGAAVGIEALGDYYGGTGNTSILMKANLTAMSLAIAFNFLLIDGRLGFPALGYKGAAWGNVLATGLAFFGFFAVFLRHGRGLGRAGLKAREFLRLLRFGLPSGLNWSFEFSAWILYVNVVVAGLGTSALAALLAVIQVNTISFMPAFGLASAGAILVGQAIGAGRPEGVRPLVKLTFWTAAAWMGLVSLCYLAKPLAFLSPFVPGQGPDSPFMMLGVAMLTMSAFWQFFDAIGITFGEMLRAAGDTAVPMWARGVLAWGVFLPGSWIHVRFFGGREMAATAWLLAYLGLLALALFLRYRGGAWKKIKLVEDSPFH